LRFYTFPLLTFLFYFFKLGLHALRELNSRQPCWILTSLSLADKDFAMVIKAWLLSTLLVSCVISVNAIFVKSDSSTSFLILNAEAISSLVIIAHNSVVTEMQTPVLIAKPFTYVLKLSLIRPLAPAKIMFLHGKKMRKSLPFPFFISYHICYSHINKFPRHALRNQIL